MSAIKYMLDGEAMDLLRPVAGRWTATVEGREVCEVEVTAEIIHTWGRLCALDVAHLLPAGCDPVVREWLETGDDGLREAARAAAWTARSVAGGLAVWEGRFAAAAAAWSSDHAAGRAVVDAAWSARAAAAAVGGGQPAPCAHLRRLIWTAHGETLTTRERIELSRDLRYRGEDEAAAAVLPVELREVTA